MVSFTLSAGKILSMVTVYVWQAAEIGGVFNQTSLGGISTMSGYVNQVGKYYDSVKQTKQIPPSGIWARSVGHVAVKLENRDHDTYFSLYPKFKGKDLDLVFGYMNTYKSKFADNLQVDVEVLGEHPHLTIKLRNLDEKAIGSSIASLNEKYNQYSLKNLNCSNLAMDVLYIGAHKKPSKIVEFLKSSVSGIKDIASTIAAYSELTGGVLPYQRFYDFEPVKSFIALQKVTGGFTPASVANYAKSLAKDIG